VNHNAFVGGTTLNASWPSAWNANSYWLANHAAAGYSDPANCGQGTNSTAACAIASGALKSGASDGTNVGVDIDGLNAATLHSVDGQW